MPYIGRGPELGVRSRFIYTATANQTSFTGNDDAGISLAYTDTLYMDVYQNGVLLVPATDYAASTGTSVVLVQGASVDDTLELLVHDIFSVADSVSAKDGGSFAGNVGMGGTLSVTGTSTLTGNTTVGGTLGVTGEATFSAAALARGAVVQRKHVSLTSTTQLTRAGTLAELSTSLRIAFTPKHASSVLYAEVSAFFVSPDSNNLIYAQIYDVTASAVASLPPEDGSRQRVHFAKRTTASDANDFDMMNFMIPIAADDTDARTYTIFVGTEGSTLQFLSSTLSTSAGANSPITFSITEIYNP